MDKNANTLNWFELPVSNFERAKKFYETIFECTIQVMDLGAIKMGLFPSVPGNGKLTGAIVQHEWYKPSQEGALIYFNGNPDLQVALTRVAAAGGSSLVPKRQISPDVGYMAVFVDTEGNRVALHSQK
jgi:uncharacterized protein